MHLARGVPQLGGRLLSSSFPLALFFVCMSLDLTPSSPPSLRLAMVCHKWELRARDEGDIAEAITHVFYLLLDILACKFQDRSM